MWVELLLFTVLSEILASSPRLLSNIENDDREKAVYGKEKLRASPSIHLFTPEWNQACTTFVMSDGAPASEKDTLQRGDSNYENKSILKGDELEEVCRMIGCWRTGTVGVLKWRRAAL